jgi:hypothetical protein
MEVQHQAHLSPEGEVSIVPGYVGTTAVTYHKRVVVESTGNVPRSQIV